MRDRVNITRGNSKYRSRLATIVTSIIIAASIIGMGLTTDNYAQAKAKKAPSIKAKAEGDFTRANFKILMHQVYENYYRAAQTLTAKDYKMSEAFLTILGYYVDKLEENFPGEDIDGNPVDEKEFIAAITNLKKNVVTLQEQVSKRKISSMEEPEKALASTCLLCHGEVVFTSEVHPAP